jgi:Peroxiredoxin
MMPVHTLTAEISGHARPTDDPPVPTRMTPRGLTIGQTVPRFSLMAFVRGNYTYLDPAALSGRWMALCFLSSPSTSDMTYVNSQAEAFAREGAVLLVVLSATSLLQLAKQEELKTFTVPLLTDSLNRIHRSYGVALAPPSATAATFLIDPARVLRFHIAHDLTLWDLNGLRGLLRSKRNAAYAAPELLALSNGAGNIVSTR